jgi:hypothetical protein
MERRICEAIEAGATLNDLEARPGFPSRMTVSRWARADPDFAQRLGAARFWRRAGRAEARVAAAAFSPQLAEAFLLRVRRGEAVRDLVRRPGQPNRELLNAWKRQRPDFARDLEAAIRFARELRPKSWERYDEAVADQVIVRLSRGEHLRRLVADPVMPSEAAVRRWGRINPEFARAVKLAQLAGLRVRGRRRGKLTPELEARIIKRILAGASLHAIAKLPGIPHHVTLYGYMRRDRGFRARVRAAERARDDMLMDRALEIAERATDATVERARGQVGALRKQVGRMTPKAWR